MKARDYIGMAAVLVLVSACSAARAPEAQTSLQDSVAGCYELRLWPERADPEAEEERATWGLMPIVELDTLPLTDWPQLAQQYGEVFVARSYLEGGRAFDHPFGYWRPAEGDSLFVGHPMALAGMSMTVAPVGEDLEGLMTSFTDILEEGRPSSVTAPVRALRVECPPDSRGR
jgi:hypothetical protein